MRILALTRYERLGSSSRVRFYQYFSYLRSHDVDLTNAPFFNDDYVRSLYVGLRTSPKEILRSYLKRLSVLLQSSSFDLLWVEKELLPWFPFGIENLFKTTNVPYVVDYDDAVFHRYDMHPLAIVRILLGSKIDNVMKNAAMVITGNEYLAERALKVGAKKVENLPSVVDVSQYAFKQHEPGSSFKIGWIGSPVTAPYLTLISDAIRKLHQETDIHLVLIGAGKTNPFPDVPTSMVQWSEESELLIGKNFDVGIMPLVDGPFERGKCGYKLVQYMAGGLPIIASPVGINRQIVEPNVNGYLAETTEEWLLALRELINNVHKREAFGHAGRQKAEQMYNLQVTAPKLLNLLSSAAKP